MTRDAAFGELCHGAKIDGFPFGPARHGPGNHPDANHAASKNDDTVAGRDLAAHDGMEACGQGLHQRQIAGGNMSFRIGFS